MSENKLWKRLASEITDGLFIGSIEAAESLDALECKNITHVLSVCCQCVQKTSSMVQYKQVAVEDIPLENLLLKFDECYEFIEEGLEGGKVLVHWPNSGFEEQLRLYERMGWMVDFRSQAARQFLLKSRSIGLSRYSKLLQTIDNEINRAFSEDPESSINGGTSSLSDPDNSLEGLTLYRCRRCRRMLFTDQSIVAHGSEMDIDRLESNEEGEMCGADPHYLLPVKWMDVLGTSEGKIHCPKCRSKLGHYCWHGQQCNTCKQWITPSFHITASNVDACSLPSTVAQQTNPTVN